MQCWRCLCSLQRHAVVRNAAEGIRRCCKLRRRTIIRHFFHNHHGDPRPHGVYHFHIVSVVSTRHAFGWSRPLTLRARLVGAFIAPAYPLGRSAIFICIFICIVECSS